MRQITHAEFLRFFLENSLDDFENTHLKMSIFYKAWKLQFRI